MANNQASSIVHIPLEIKINQGGTTILAQGHAMEIDRDGMFVRINQELPSNTDGFITLKPPNDAVVVVQGKVLWCENVHGNMFDAGIIVPEKSQMYSEFVERLEQSMENRRSVKRYPKRLSISFRSKESFFHEFTTNISTGGLFIKTNNPLDEMTEIDLELNIPGMEEPVVVTARVVFVLRPEQVPNAHTPPGMGVEFVRFKQGDDLRFYLYLDKLRRLYERRKG